MTPSWRGRRLAESVSTRLNVRKGRRGARSGLGTPRRWPSVRPGPVAQVRVVLAVLPRPGSRPEALVDHLLAQACRLAGQPWHAVDDVHDEVEAIEVVEHDHVEGRRRRALFLVAAHVEVAVVRPSVGEAVDEPGIAVVGE